MISAVVLTHNDEGHLAKTLASISWCDEVIVVDDESTDKTIDIATKRGASVYTRKLDGDFAAQRNFGLGKAKGPARNASQSDAGGEWVLFVDSDEIVSEELAREITSLTYKVIPAKAGIQNGTNDGSRIKSGMTATVGYYLKRRDWMWGKWLKYGETSRVRLLRLAKKNAGKWQRPVHEVWSVDGATGELVNPLLHYPHQNVAQFLDEINRYSTLNARYLYSLGNHVSWWQIFAYPKLKFFRSYIWYLGFLDGTAGMVVALMMSFHSFLTRAKLWKLWDKT